MYFRKQLHKKQNLGKKISNKVLECFGHLPHYCIYPKYSNILTPYQTCCTIWTSSFNYLLLHLKAAIRMAKLGRSWSDTIFYDKRSGSTLLAQACLSKYLVQKILLYLWYQILNLVLLNLDMSCLCKQCRSRSVGLEANWSRSALFAIKYVNLYQQSDQIICLAEN